MKPRRRPRRFSTLMIVTFSVLMGAIVLVMGIVSYQYSYRSLADRTIADNQVILTVAADNLSRYIDSIRAVSAFIDQNKDIRAYLEDPDAEGAGLLRTSFSSFLNYLPQIDSSVVSVFIFDRRLQIVYAPADLRMKPEYDLSEEEWYRTISLDHSSAPHLIGTTVRRMTMDSNPWVISIARNILNGRTGEIIGMQLVELDYSALNDILSDVNLGRTGYVFIVDSRGRMIYHPQMELINFGIRQESISEALSGEETVFLEPENKIYNIHSIPGTDYLLVGVTYIDMIVSTANQMLLLYLLMTLILALAAFVGAVQLTKFITKPLAALEQSANRINSGDLNTVFDGSGTVETESVAQSLERMLQTVKELMAAAVRDQERIRRSDIRALQSQINPHFLYNTLDSIVWLAEEAGNREIREMTMALASYFRVVLSQGRDLITLKEELTHAESYLIIQKMRYQNLDYEFEVEPAALSLYVPKLIVQPILENAIYHGIRDNGSRGRILVRAWVEGPRLFIEVEDNGRGMRERELKTVYTKKENRKKSGGFGLGNVKERIELYYGHDCGIEISSVFRKGTVVRMMLMAVHALEGPKP